MCVYLLSAAAVLCCHSQGCYLFPHFREIHCLSLCLKFALPSPNLTYIRTRMCVNVCVYIHIYIYTHTHTHTHTHTYMCVCVCIYIYIYIQTHTHTHTHTHTRTRPSTWARCGVCSFVCCNLPTEHGYMTSSALTTRLKGGVSHSVRVSRCCLGLC